MLAADLAQGGEGGQETQYASQNGVCTSYDTSRGSKSRAYLCVRVLRGQNLVDDLLAVRHQQRGVDRIELQLDIIEDALRNR